MKVNTGTSTLDRLRIVIGSTMVVAGLITIVFVNSLFAFSNIWLWLIGGALILTGVYVARNAGVMSILNDFR